MEAMAEPTYLIPILVEVARPEAAATLGRVATVGAVEAAPEVVMEVAMMVAIRLQTRQLSLIKLHLPTVVLGSLER